MLISEYLEFPKGDPREPMTIEDLDNKFIALSSQLLSSRQQKELSEVIFNCEDLSARKFMSSLVIKPKSKTKKINVIKKASNASKQKGIRRKTRR